MDKRATGPALSQDKKEKWMSIPASSPRNDTREAQAPTQGSPQPYDYFLGSERTMSPPPVSLEKGVDPSQGSQPNTPAASTISCLSRSDTLNSSSTLASFSTLNSSITTQTQESGTTLCSQSSSSSDDTVSVPRSQTFPAMASYPNDRKILPKETTIRMVELRRSLYKQHAVLPSHIGGSAPPDQSSPGRSNTYLMWPYEQGEVAPVPNNQAPPSRHFTFPIEILRDSGRLVDKEISTISPPQDPFLFNRSPEDVTISNTDMCYDMFKQEMPPDEPEFRSLQAQKDVFLKSRLTTPEQWMIGLLDSKEAGLQCQLAPNPSFLSQRRKNLHRNRPLSKARKEPERVMNLASHHYEADGEQPYSPGSTTSSVANTITTPEATAEPEGFRQNQAQPEAEETQDSGFMGPSLPNEPSGGGNRESSSQGSDDDASFPHEECSPENEEDEDFAYDQLVENITNLVLESSCVGNVEEQAVPVELYVHKFLEQILNHPKPITKGQTVSLPIRNLPMENTEAPCEAGEPGSRGRGQWGHGGSSSGNKRKNKEAPSQSGNRASEDEDDFGEGSEEGRSQEDKKRKTSRSGGKLSCPFRKRNPIRFNVRDHASCALNGFADFALLKRHIKTSHQKKSGSSSCFRCKETFADQAALKHHSIQPEGCLLRDAPGNEDPEDGITEEVEQVLKERAKVNSVHSWESLWKRLFPEDLPERIPDPYHEPPVELDEVQNQFHNEQAVCRFIHQQTIEGEKGITAHGFQYIEKTLWLCRDLHGHERSGERLRQHQRFMGTVHTELLRREFTSQPQQSYPSVVCDPPHGVAPDFWVPNLDNSQSFGVCIPPFNGQYSFPIMPDYTNGFGINPSQVPAPGLNPSSEGAVQHAAPQHGPTTPYKDMLAQNDRPCSATGGSPGRSSGPSSQTHDSGYQTSQEQNAAALLHQQQHHHQHAEYARPGDHGWASSFSTSMGDIPSQHAAIPRQRSSELRGIDPRLPVPEECADAGSNGEEGFSPL